jgi:3-oxoacyl-[acyl-carrier-protein] synthase II
MVGGGSVALLLEAAETAPADRVLGRVTGFGLVGDGSGCGQLSRDETNWARSFTLALAEADLSAGAVDAVISAASGLDRIDDIERRALEQTGLSGQAVFTPKGLVGDLNASGPLLGIAMALWMGQRTSLSPESFAYQPGFGPLPNQVKTALVSSFEVGGSYQAVALSTS